MKERKAYSHESDDIFDAIGIKIDDIVDYWNKFILGYVFTVVKFIPEENVKFLADLIRNRGKSRFMAYCIANVLHPERLHRFIVSMDSLIGLTVIRERDLLKVKESSMKNIRITDKAWILIEKKAKSLLSQLREKDKSSEQVELIELFLLADDFGYEEKGIIIDTIILKFLDRTKEKIDETFLKKHFLSQVLKAVVEKEGKTIQ